ncbi:hypothetical protein NUBL22018_49670 [Klebsiella variicola]|nr:hypothetical protein NUBL22018_49670 [Klebsiella variicola]
MLMSVTTENAPVQGQTTLQENRAGEGVYASLFEKINLAPASRLGDINDFLDDAALSEAPAAERLTAAMQVFMERIRQSGYRCCCLLMKRTPSSGRVIRRAGRMRLTC